MKKYSFVSLIFPILLLFSCGKSINEEISNNPLFAEHIAAHTAGVVSTGSRIQVQLTESPVGLDIKVPLGEDVFNFQPTIEGEAVWIDNKTIEFVPKSKLKADTKYIVNFNLNKIKKVPESIEQFVFNFSTIKQYADVSILGLNTPNSENWGSQILEGSITFSDIVDTANLIKSVIASQNGNQLPIKWNKQSDKQYQFIVSNVVRNESKTSTIKIEFNGTALGITENITKEYTIYPQNKFVVTDVNVVQYPDQFVDVHFSDPISSNQNFAGLVSIDGVQSPTYAVNGHHLKVFLTNPIEGNKQINVFAGVQNTKGEKFQDNFSKTLTFETTKPNVREIGNGVIMPTSNGLRFPFEAVNLKAVDVMVTKVYENNLVQFLQVNNMSGQYQLKRVGKQVATKKINLQSTGVDLTQWNKFFVDLSDIVKEEKGALYQIHIRFKKEYANYPCVKSNSELEEVETGTEEKEWSEKDWDTYGYYNDYEYFAGYDYDYSQRDNPCHDQYYRNKSLRTNFILSDIGLIAKAGADKVLQVFVTDIKTAQPMSGVEVDIYNFQQQVIGTVNTDGEGMASISLDEKPFVIIAKQAGQRGYLKLKDGEALSLSKFDVAGATIQKGVKGFIYGERGVWRPGDSIYLSFMMEDKENILPNGHPIEFKFFNPKNQLVERKLASKNNLNLYDFRTATHTEAPTGNYRAQIKVGNRYFTKYIKVETVKPNRLKIDLKAKDELLTRYNNQNLDLNVEWLHGASAGGLKAKVDVAVDQAGTSFDKFENYTFDDPTKRFRSTDLTIFNGNVDATGYASVPVKFNVDDAAPGMLNMHFSTKVFEKGGGFSVNQISYPYSPYTSYAGVDVPEGDMYAGTLETNKKHRFSVANVSEEGKPLNGNLEVKIYKIEWRWWWDNYDGDVANYISRSSTVPVFNSMISTSNGKGNFEVEFDAWGRYVVLVKDVASGHSSGQIFYTDEPYWARSNRTDNEFATMLAFSTDKEKYEVGEEVKITFPSSANGRALISVESGTKVITKKWIKTEDGVTKDYFKVTPEMTPNVYINITLLQPHAETENDLPIRMYGVVPISVENKDSHLEPVIEMPDVLRPESEATISIKEKDGKPMNYTLAVVDEGLLDLTGFQTPNPWNHFYAREALGVKTWDLYDYVMNAYTLEMDKVLATGGGGSLNRDKNPATANRFEPMVRFMGPFTLTSGKANHKIKIPNYIGSVKVMVVTSKDTRYGSADKQVKVRKPLMVLGTLPRVVGPTEDIALPVNVFAMEKQVKNVQVRVKTNDMFELENGKQSITFSETGDQVVNFKLKTKNKIGIGKVEIYAKSGNLTAKDIIEIDVRPSNPKVTDVIETVVQAGESWSSDFAFNGIKGTNNATLEVSSIPPINLEKRLKYLIGYPHGCIEQTTSAVFPQLFLTNIMELDDTKKAEIQKNVTKGLERLKMFQTNSGGFAYWPGQVENNEWGTIYGAHFVLEAENKGYSIPHGMKNQLIKYMKKQASAWRKASNTKYYGYYANNDLIQAYRLYVLALSGNAQLGAMNRLRETKGLKLTAKWRLAGAYQLINKEKVANELIFNSSTDVENYSELSYTYGSGYRDEAMILEVLSAMDKKAKAASLAKKIAERMSEDRWMSTQTTAYCLIGMSKFLEKNKTSKQMSFTYAFNGKSAKSETTTQPIFQEAISKFGDKGGSVSLSNKGQGLLYVRLITEGIPVVGSGTKSASNLTMDVQYLNTDGTTINPNSIKQGTDFKVKVKVFNPGTKGDLEEMALTQIFPSGWEIHNTRMNSHFGSGSSAYFDYQDIRDDRIYTYFDLRKGETKTFTFQLNATYLGRFYKPTVLCEAMYDATVSAREPGNWVEVVE